MKLKSNFNICLKAVYWIKCHFLSLFFLLKAEKVSCSKNVVKGSGEPTLWGEAGGAGLIQVGEAMDFWLWGEKSC